LRIWKFCKRISRRFRFPVAAERQRILFILGCQRSGTTLATRIFERDWNARVFNEFSELSSDDDQFGIRLDALEKVKNTVRNQPYALIVAKPIVESQRAHELLHYFGNSKILWIYRSFLDVAASDLLKFGERNGIDNIRPIISGGPDNWRSQNVSASVRETLAQYFSEDMNPLDAAALFWYSRNMHFFDTNLHNEVPSGQVMLLPYERLTKEADKTIQAVYRMVGRRYPGSRVISEVDPTSVGKGRSRDDEISDRVRQICQSLLANLDQVAGYSRVS
jgi:hypothetical protein